MNLKSFFLPLIAISTWLPALTVAEPCCLGTIAVGALAFAGVGSIQVSDFSFLTLQGLRKTKSSPYEIS